MGEFMKEYDVLIPGFLEALNLRFAPVQAQGPEWLGGITELAALQSKHQIFQKGRTLAESAAILGVGGMDHAQAKTRWLALLQDLNSYDTNRGTSKGNDAIIEALLENFAKPHPLPVFFKAHDSRVEGRRKVFVGDEPHPVFYMKQEYLTISIPMKPRGS